jgi:hypothetical protein
MYALFTCDVAKIHQRDAHLTILGEEE